MIKYLGINLTKEVIDLYTENCKTLMKELEEINGKYCENVHTTQSDLQIQCNPDKNSNGSFYRKRKSYLKICMKPQKTFNSQRNFVKEEQSWRHNTF